MAVSGIEIRSRAPYKDGIQFGAAGAFERIDGRLLFDVDPLLPANRVIVDLDRAPRDNAGKVRFAADFCVIQPVDPARGNRRLLIDVPNRGGKTVRRFNNSVSPLTPTDRFEPGDGFLFRRGWTLAWCAWQWDVLPGPGNMSFEAPVALNGDRPLEGSVAVQFQPAQRVAEQPLGHGIGLMQIRAYTAADLDQPDAQLTVREQPAGPRTVLPRSSWRFARRLNGKIVPDAGAIRLDGGFAPGKIYEVIYRTNVCPVVGAGLLATRDAVAFFRGKAADNPCAGRTDYLYGYGVSQSGRFLRHFLHLGLNVDEAGRQVFDGLLPDIAGARRGEFNHRYAQPSVTERPGFGYLPPFGFDACEDGLGGLLGRQRALGGVPKLITTNSASEYWGFGGGSLVHTDAYGARDVEPPNEVRVYALAGTQHGGGRPELLNASLLQTPATHPGNVVDYTPLTRASLINLDRWVSEGVEPPPSAFPRLADGSAVRPAAVAARLAELPGLTPPDVDQIIGTPRLDLGPEPEAGMARHPVGLGPRYGQLVSAVDTDGNEVAGIRLPELAAPVATYLGWNVRHPDAGGEGQLVMLTGSTLPFPATAADRRAAGDPRPAIAERYRDRDDYAAQARAVAERLAAERYILPEDVELAVSNALTRYDLFTRAPAASATG